ncbi:uncharacterized protein LOC144910993 [Branchiostoma floridae x Branchiostoma belcheri]
MLKPRSVLDAMDDEDDNIFCTSPLDRYVCRPNVLEKMSLAEFSATYTTGGSYLPDDHIPDVLDGRDENGAADNEGSNQDDMYPAVITLQNNLGTMRKRKKHCIIRFHKERKDGEDKYRNLLMLYLPWRNEEVDIKATFPSFKEHYEHVIDTIRANEAMFSINADAVNAAYDDLRQNGPPEDMWDSVAPNVEFQQAEQQDEGITVETEVFQEDQCGNIDLAPHSTSSPSCELHARFSAEMNKVLMSSEEYRAMMRSLNSQQMEVLRFHRKWCKDTIIALKQNQHVPQYMVFLSGPGGVGKSHVIKLVHHETLRLLRPLSGHYFDPNDLPVMLTAFTGTAAFGINGMTLHSALSLSCGLNRGKDYQPLSSDRLNTLRSRLGKLKLLVVDEVSMVGADLLYHIHRRLQDICGSPDPDSRFGGVSILAVGDLFQLQPVGQNHVFGLPSDSYAKLHGSLWEENFHMMELTESMRQKEDQNFANLLMRVRTASCTEDDIHLLKSRVISRTDPSYPSEALHVFKTNREVDEHNAKHLTTLSSKVFDIKAIDSKKDLLTGFTNVAMSTKPSDTGGLREVVSVAVGARVMVTVNIDVADGLVNGTFATVVGVDSTGPDVHTILVKFDSDRVGKQAITDSQYKQAYPGAVPIKRQTVQFFAGKGRRSVQAQRAQFPLSLAWGCTIHKVQGKTLSRIVVSMESKGCFMPGQAYVALSRVRSLNDLYLLGFKPTSIRVNTAVLDEMLRLRLQQVPVPKVPLSCSSTVGNNDLTIKFLNIRSYTEHLQDLKADKTALPFDVFCFVETFLHKNQQADLFLPHSLSFRADRVGRGGGVMTVARQDIIPTQLHIPVGGLEYTAITITKESTTVNIVNIYRPQTLPEEDFINRLQRLLILLPSKMITVVLGDFNFDLLKCPPPKILNVMEQFGFRQFVQSPTTDYGSLLDHVYVRGLDEDSLLVTVHDTYYSDHDMVCVSLML